MLPNEGKRRRRPHQRWLRQNGFRELLIAHRWSLKGGCTEKRIHGRQVIMMLLRETPEWRLMHVGLKADFWSDIINDNHNHEAQKTRESFHVVKD